MAVLPTTLITSQVEGGQYAVTGWATFSGAGTTNWIKFANTNVTVQADGTATSMSATVERTTRDPNAGPVTQAPADGVAFTGSAAAGLTPNVYQETGVAWWRVNVASVSGGSVTFSLSGMGGGLN